MPGQKGGERPTYTLWCDWPENETTAELVHDLLQDERHILLHSPSGAGRLLNQSHVAPRRRVDRTHAPAQRQDGSEPSEGSDCAFPQVGQDAGDGPTERQGGAVSCPVVLRN